LLLDAWSVQVEAAAPVRSFSAYKGPTPLSGFRYGARRRAAASGSNRGWSAI